MENTNNTLTVEEIEQKSKRYKELQEKTNKERLELIKTFSPEVQERSSKIEEFVGWMDKEDLPFIFIVNYHGFLFDRTKKIGFIQYNKFHKQNDLYSEESLINRNKCYCGIIDSALAVLSTLAPVRIVLEEGKSIFDYIGGKMRTFLQPEEIKSQEIKKQ